MVQDKAFYEKRKAEFAASIPPEQCSRTIPQFCYLENISEPVYYELRKKKLGPKESRYGDLVRITPEAHAEWRRKTQTAKFQRAAKIANTRAVRAKLAIKSRLTKAQRTAEARP